MQKISLKAYAKVNLSMEILGRREDNFHEIRTLMQFVSLYDRVDIEISDVFSMKCSDKALENIDNLCAKAYFALAEYMGKKLSPVKIYLEKNIPYLSGLGGGSADAAAVLVGLNLLMDLKLTQAELLKIAETIGSDVSACLLGGLVLAQGRGEKVTQTSPIVQSLEIVLVKPSFGFSSSDMYKLLDKDDVFSLENHTQRTIDSLNAENCIYLYNGFLIPKYAKKHIDEIKSAFLESGAIASSMTGAGSAVFGVFCNSVSAKLACQSLSKNFGEEYFVAYCHSVNTGVELFY